MTCCIALAVTIAIVRSAWTFVTGRRIENAFAPVARRRAPGEDLEHELDPIRASPESPAPSARRFVAHGLFAGGVAWLVAIAAEPYVAPILGLGCACCATDRALHVGAGLGAVFLALGLLAPASHHAPSPKESTP